MQLEYYHRTIESGLHKLFEPPESLCPMCGSTELVREQTVQDWIQLKPGYFHMSRCRTCGHIFQNPRLNASGLEFYYGDFYTGAGETAIHQHLASMQGAYRKRARMITGFHEPRRWLDVGAGYGHFSRVARGIWRGTEFHVLDVSPSIQNAMELGWAERAFAGPFLQLVPELKGSYDVVSMFHYLEHTVDPIAELCAAAAVLDSHGFVMIEVPDPDSVGRRLMGRHWPSWLAPQHLHLIPSRNMERYLRDAGLEPVLWHRASAHQAIDATFATENYLRYRYFNQSLPWVILDARANQTGRGWIQLLAMPVRAAMRILDVLLSPLRYFPRWSNTYRVLAIKSDRSEREAV